VRTPFVVLTDLDAAECALQLIGEWLSVPKHPNLLFRIAVREVESWLIADTKGLSEFFAVPKSMIPSAPDKLEDPKATVVELARRSRSKAIRDRIVPRRKSTAKTGPDYNGCLGSFVRGSWDIQAAKANSPSLARTVDRLLSFRPTWSF
jgi:hypothetical protein